MTRRERSGLLTRAKTIGFILALIPVMLAALLVGLLSLVIASPLMVYASILGKHLKDPRKNSLIPESRVQH